MEEDEYKSTYSELASIRCVFEKALVNYQASDQVNSQVNDQVNDLASQQTSRQIKCKLSRHFCLADREGYSCEDSLSSRKCSEFLKLLRKNSVFALKLREANGPLPHNMEIRVQVGGLTGLAKLAEAGDTSKSVVIDDINQLLKQLQKKIWNA